MEGTVGDAKEGLSLGVVGILAIALEKSKCRHEVALLQEVAGVWESELLLLLCTVDKARVSKCYCN